MGHTKEEHEDIMRQNGTAELVLPHRCITTEYPVETHNGREWRAEVSCSCGQWASGEVAYADVRLAEAAFRAHRDWTDGGTKCGGACRHAKGAACDCVCDEALQ